MILTTTCFSQRVLQLSYTSFDISYKKHFLDTWNTITVERQIPATFQYKSMPWYSLQRFPHLIWLGLSFNANEQTVKGRLSSMTPTLYPALGSYRVADLATSEVHIIGVHDQRVVWFGANVVPLSVHVWATM